jgi:hypothetical protein
VVGVGTGRTVGRVIQLIVRMGGYIMELGCVKNWWQAGVFDTLDE